MDYQVMPALAVDEGKELKLGFKSVDGLLRIVPSKQCEKWFCFLIEKETMTETYSQEPVEWDTVLYFLNEHRYNEQDIRPFRCRPIQKPLDVDKHELQATNLYIIQAITGGPIKIGIANNVSNRLARLQTGSPSKLVVVKSVKGVSPSA